MTTIPPALPPPRASGDTFVYVVGMHRSGTSAVTEVLSRLGLGMPRPDDLIPATPSNRRGHWESKQLTDFNEHLLRRLGGAWTSPPELAPGWQADDSLAGMRTQGASHFATIFGPRPAAWKDPRLCIVLPFWKTIVQAPTAAVLVYREPHEVAASLRSRNGMPMTHGLALWERYVRRACADLTGVPTIAVDYRRVLERSGEWCEDLVAFLKDVGVTIDPADLGPARSSLDAELHHQRTESTRSPGLPSSPETVMESLRAIQGAYHPWRAPALGPEPAWVSDVLELRRAFDRLERDHRWATASRAYRLATWARRRRARA